MSKINFVACFFLVFTTSSVALSGWDVFGQKNNICKMKYGAISPVLKEDCSLDASADAYCALVKSTDKFSANNCDFITILYDRICIDDKRCGNGNLLMDGYRERKTKKEKEQTALAPTDDDEPSDPPQG